MAGRSVGAAVRVAPAGRLDRRRPAGHGRVGDRGLGVHRRAAAPRAPAGRGRASVSLALNSAATHVGFAVGALLGGLVVDTAGPGPLALLGVALGGAGLILHRSLDPEVRS